MRCPASAIKGQLLGAVMGEVLFVVLLFGSIVAALFLALLYGGE